MNHTGQKPPSNPKIKAVAIIPARYDSVRLPGKALLEIAGKPMICYVAEQARAARNVERVIVATDDQRIVDAVKSAGCEVVLTSADHQSGTDRIAEVAASLNDADIIVNVQGDEPLISPETIERAIDEMREKGEEIGIVTTWEPMGSIADVVSADVVKIVIDADERALYFSRSAGSVSARGCASTRDARVSPQTRARAANNFSQTHRALRLPSRCLAGVHALATIRA